MIYTYPFRCIFHLKNNSFTCRESFNFVCTILFFVISILLSLENFLRRKFHLRQSPFCFHSPISNAISFFKSLLYYQSFLLFRAAKKKSLQWMIWPRIFLARFLDFTSILVFHVVAHDIFVSFRLSSQCCDRVVLVAILYNYHQVILFVLYGSTSVRKSG